MRILGIETSCDETCVAVYDEDHGLIVNRIYSQSKLHSLHGGVVPELAARDHIRKIVFLIQDAILGSGFDYKDMDAIAYTAGPGLMGSLIVGATVGHALAYACQVPVIKVHHIEGHILTPLLEGNMFDFPVVSLVVSGGHTQLIFIDSIGKYKILGKSLDDAAGEVFDKVGRLLGFGYPGGAVLSQMARKGVSGRYYFPRPMIRDSSLDFSFSGLKTHVSNVIVQNSDDDQTRCDIARAFEDAMVDVLSFKCQQALDLMTCKSLLLAGGVSANLSLRSRLASVMKIRGGKFFCATPDFCTDNAAMIAYVGMLRFNLGLFRSNDLIVLVKPRWSIEDLSIAYS